VKKRGHRLALSDVFQKLLQLRIREVAHAA